MVFGQVAAFDGELEQGADQTADVVLRSTSETSPLAFIVVKSFERANIFFDLLAGDTGITELVAVHAKCAEARVRSLI